MARRRDGGAVPARDPWTADFSPRLPAREDELVPVRDFWLPRPPVNAANGRLARFVRGLGRPERGDYPLADPWMAGIPPLDPPTIRGAAFDWAMAAGRIPTFTAGLAENPFAAARPVEVALPEEAPADRRARWLMQLLGSHGRGRHELYRALFARHADDKTFRMLSGFVADGVPAAWFVPLASLKLAAEDNPHWLSQRSRTGKITTRSGAQLSWTRALRFVELLGGTDPTETIEALYEDWRREDGARQAGSFLAWCEVRLDLSESMGFAHARAPRRPPRPSRLRAGAHSRTADLVRGRFDELGFADPLDHRSWAGIR